MSNVLIAFVFPSKRRTLPRASSRPDEALYYHLVEEERRRRRIYGTPNGIFLRPFHTYTIKNKINSRNIVIALDHYSNAVPKIVVDGTSLCDTETCLLGDFLEHLHKRRQAYHGSSSAIINEGRPKPLKAFSNKSLALLGRALEMVLIEGLHRLMLHALAQVIQSPKHTDDSVWPGASPLILPISAQACLFNIHICLNIFHILCILLQSSERPVKCNSQVLDWAIIVDTDLNQKGDVAKVAYPKFHCSFCCPISGGENWHPFDPLGFFDC